MTVPHPEAPPAAPTPTPGDAAAARVFPGTGEMAARCRALDWAATPLGPVDRWPQSLRTTAALVLAAPVGMIVLWGPELVQLYNDAYRDVMGAKHPAGLGQPTRACWPEVWDFTAPIYEGVMARGEAFTFQDQRLVVERYGVPEEAFFTLSFSPVPDDAGVGAVGGVLVTVFETTAQVRGRRAEAERARLAEALGAERTGLLEEVFRRAPSFLHVLCGSDFVFELANEAYYQLVGRRDLLGRPAFEAMPEAAAGGFPERLARVMATGEPFVGRELPVTLARTPGAPPEERLVDLVYLPLVDADGARTRVLGHGTDVTDHVQARRRTEAALAERTAAAEAANRAKAEFLSTMSHELRTPLNAIGGYAELLELGIRGPVTEAQRADLGRIQASQRHLLGLVNEVLDLAKVDAGEVRVERAAVPVAPTVDAALALVRPQAAAKALALGESCGGAADAAYVGDEPRVRQILVNLLANAVKFTPPGGRVAVTCALGDAPPAVRRAAAASGGAALGQAALGDAPDGPYLALRVEDTGVGIAAGDRERVFQPFTQAGDGTNPYTRPVGGTGLGLTISRRFARLMGGDITLESTPGAGSTFTLWLPAPERRSQPRPTPAPPATASRGAGGWRSPAPTARRSRAWATRSWPTRAR